MTYGFIGLGLIGGSIAKALKAAEPECRVYAYMRSAARLELARGEGIVDVVLTGGGDGRIRDCDILFLCTPVEVAADYLRQLKPLLKEGAFITDVGSTKSAMEKVTLELGMGDRFIGGHPMAGSEKSGYEFSDPVLLENIFYLLCPTPDTPPAFVERMQSVVRAIRANPYLIDAEEHDRAVAAISHLPHIAAAALVNLVHRTDGPRRTMKQLAAGGFKDITRIASSSPVMWQQIFSSNRAAVLEALGQYISALQEVEKNLREDDMAAIHDLFAESGAYRSTFADEHGLLEAQYSFSVHVQDRPGAISVISAILAAAGINIKNIGINHNRETGSGALRVEFYDAGSCSLAERKLREYNYTVVSHRK